MSQESFKMSRADLKPLSLTGNPQIIEDEHLDYMDMTPNSTPNRSFVDANVSSYKPPAQNSNKTLSSLKKNSSNVHESFETLFKGDDDYADMSGAIESQQGISTMTPQRRYQQPRPPQRYGIVRPIDKTKYTTVSRIGRIATADEDFGRLHSPTLASTSAVSRNRSRFAEGGYHKNDEDDYAEIKTENKSESNLLSVYKTTTMSFGDEYRTSAKSFSDAKLSSTLALHQSFDSSLNFDHSSARKRAETAKFQLESNKDILPFVLQKSDKLLSPNDKSKTLLAGFARNENLRQNSETEEKVKKNKNLLPKVAGQHLDSNLSPQRSGKKGGVQNRIRKVHQTSSFRQDSHQNKPDAIASHTLDATPRNRNTKQGKTTKDELNSAVQGSAGSHAEHIQHKAKTIRHVHSVSDLKESNYNDSLPSKRTSRSFENFEKNYLDSRVEENSDSQRSLSVTSDLGIRSGVISTGANSPISNKADENSSEMVYNSPTTSVGKPIARHQTLPYQSPTKQKRKRFWRWPFKLGKSKEKKKTNSEKTRSDSLPQQSFAKRRDTWMLRSNRRKTKKSDFKTDVAIKANNFNSPNKRESIIDATLVISPYTQKKQTLPNRQGRQNSTYASGRFDRKKSQTLSHSLSESAHELSSVSSISSSRDFEKSPKLHQRPNNQLSKTGEKKSTYNAASDAHYLETNLDDDALAPLATLKTTPRVQSAKPQPKFTSTLKAHPTAATFDISKAFDDNEDDDDEKRTTTATTNYVKSRNNSKSKTLGKLFSTNHNNRKSSKDDPILEPLPHPAIFESHLLKPPGSCNLQSQMIHKQVAIFNTQNCPMSHGFIVFPTSFNQSNFKGKTPNQQHLTEKKTGSNRKQPEKHSLSGRKKKTLDLDFNDQKSRSKSTSDLDDEGHFNGYCKWKTTKKLLRSTDLLDKSPKDLKDSEKREKDSRWPDFNETVEFSERVAMLRATATKPKVHPIFPKPSLQALEATQVFLNCIKATQPDLIVGFEQIHEELHTHFFTADQDNQHAINNMLRWSYAKGHDLVTWTEELLRAKERFDHADDEFYKPNPLPSRQQITGMWQVLYEEGAIFHVKCEEQFEDADLFYGFHEEVTSPKSISKFFQSLNLHNLSHSKEIVKSNDVMSKLMSHWLEELDLADAISYLQKHCHDALFRKALQRQPEKRTSDELKLIYEEIIHIKPIVHLSDSVKRELAGVIKYEFHHEPGSIVFKQGDEGTCWYIILHGSVKVDILGKGNVCTLHDGDDFGNLALVNDAPRSASIIVAEENCHFLKVDKIDFNRILKDVEANTVRLKEHEKDVLVLQKIRSPSRKLSDSGSDHGIETEPSLLSHRYSVTAGTPEAIIEHILEYLHPWEVTNFDETLEEFVLMHLVFMSTKSLMDLLLKIYRSEDPLSSTFEKSMKRKVVYFVVRWSHIMTYMQHEPIIVKQFLQNVENEIEFDCRENHEFMQLKYELSQVYSKLKRSDSQSNSTESYLVIEENVQRYQTGQNQVELQRPIRDDDEVLLKVYSCDKVYTTVKLAVSSSVSDIINAIAEKTNTPPTELKLMEVQESGDTYEIAKSQNSVITSLSLNSVLSVCDHCERRTYIGNFRSPATLHDPHFDAVCSMELAYYITEHDWQLVNNVHVMEYIYKVFRKKFRSATPNLDMLSRRFNQLAYWPPTEICTCSNIHKRALMLRKFIKIAHHLKTLQNMNAFMALMMGIVNSAVSRLHATWEKVPAKYRKQVQEYEALLDPSRNHRNYRLMTSSLEPPFIPHLPLLLKDMTFQHEGNEDQKQDLINFEKMRMISNSVKKIIRGCSERIEANSEITSSKTATQTSVFAKNFKVITDQKKLNELSAQIEPKR